MSACPTTGVMGTCTRGVLGGGTLGVVDYGLSCAMAKQMCTNGGSGNTFTGC